MKIDSIKNGIVIDHIKAKNGMKIYEELNLSELDCSVAIITNVKSNKYGKKDIIKIDKDIDVNIEMLGYIDSNATINVIENSKIIKKYSVPLPKVIKNISICQNPRCITTIEHEIDQIFYLTNIENKRK